jgi:hypothetical protein
MLFESCFAVMSTLVLIEELLANDSSGVVSTIDSSEFLLFVSSTPKAAESSGVVKTTDCPSSDNYSLSDIFLFNC